MDGGGPPIAHRGPALRSSSPSETLDPNLERPPPSVSAGQGPFVVVWRVLGSNQRRRTPADLQTGSRVSLTCTDGFVGAGIAPDPTRLLQRWSDGRDLSSLGTSWSQRWMARKECVIRSGPLL